MVRDPFAPFITCKLLLADGRSGTIRLINLGNVARFIGHGQLEESTA